MNRNWRLYDVPFKRGYNVSILRSCFHQNQRFALTTFVNAHFLGVLNRQVLKRGLFENKHGRNSVLLITTFENADFGLKS